ncbi:pilin [Pseudomonadota bacterium]
MIKKQTLKQIGIVLILIVASLTISATLVSAQVFDLPPATSYGDIPAPTSGGTAQQQFAELVWGIVQNVRFILGAIAIAMIVYAGFRMVTGWGDEETYSKSRKSIFYGIIGLALVGLAGEAAQIFSVDCPAFTPPGQSVIPCKEGGFLKDPNSLIRTATLFNQQTQIIITFIKYLAGAIAILMIVRSGARLVTSSSSEENVAQDKKNLAYSGIGLILIIIADNVISNIFYKVDLSRYPGTGGAAPAVDPVQGVKEIIGFTNIVVNIVGPIAVLALLAGGVMYITAGGQEEKMNQAKRLILSALIGIIIIYGAFAIVSTIVAGRFA